VNDIEHAAPPMGWVPTTGRGSLPFVTLDGEPLVALASFALEGAGVELVDFDAELADVWADRPLVVHDPLCPLTPISFLRRAVEVATEDGVAVVGVHPVTDTVKAVRGEVVGQTVDREGLWVVTSPVVLPASLVAKLDGWPDTDDLVAPSWPSVRRSASSRPRRWLAGWRTSPRSSCCRRWLPSRRSPSGPCWSRSPDRSTTHRARRPG
jgi:2-C-methyl-D-erythritol 4-phosphate cytidylyltransferase